MTRPDLKTLLTGALAGVTAALLVLGASTHPSYSVMLYAASAMPVLIVGLGWGNFAAIAAIVTAAALGAAFISPGFAVVMTVVTLGPAGWLSHLANLARPADELGGPNHLLAWYPLSDILLHLCGLVTAGVAIVGVIVDYGPELTGKMVDLMMASMQAQEPGFRPDPAVIAETKRLVLLLLPMIQGGLWVILLFAAYYFATRIVSLSGRGLRPREDISSSLRMNRHAIFAFLAGLVACFTGGVAAMIGAIVCGAFGAGFLMAGFASLHYRSRGKSWRLPALVIAYLLALMVLPALIFVVAGMADTRRAIALTPIKNADTNDNINT